VAAAVGAGDLLWAMLAKVPSRTCTGQIRRENRNWMGSDPDKTLYLCILVHS